MSRFDRAPSEADYWQRALLVVAVFALFVIVSAYVVVNTVSPVPPPSTSTPTITRTPLPLVEIPPTETQTASPTSSPTLTYDEIDGTVLAMNPTRTPAPPTPAVNPQTGGEQANVGMGIALFGGIWAAFWMAAYYLRIKKL